MADCYDRMVLWLERLACSMVTGIQSRKAERQKPSMFVEEAKLASVPET